MNGLFLPLIVMIICAVLPACTSRKNADPPKSLFVANLPVRTLDPVFADELPSIEEVGRVYEGLLQYHYLKRPYVLVPNLAETMPSVSADQKVLTFHLKKGVLFQDSPAFRATGGRGRELTAGDVVYSLMRLADPRLKARGWWALDGRIVGLNEWRAAAEKSGSADYAKTVRGLLATERYTVEIHLTQPSPTFLYVLAMPYTAVVPREAVEYYGTDFQRHPVGTGPFELKDYKSPGQLIWNRNPTYRREVYPSEGEPGDKEAGRLEDAGKPLPMYDRVVVRILSGSGGDWGEFLAGKQDMIEVPKDHYAEVITPSKELEPTLAFRGIRLIKSARMDVTYEAFNMADPVLGKNKLLRQALSLAYDSEGMAALFYNGRGVPAQGPIPPGLSGYDEKFRNSYRQFNLLKAKDLLAKAGFPNGEGAPEIDYLTVSRAVDKQMAEFLAESFKILGLKVNVRAVSWDAFDAAIEGNKAQMWSGTWSADYPDAESFLRLFYSKDVFPGPNRNSYRNPEFDQLFEKSLTLKDGPERTVLYQRMATILAEDCPWIFGIHRMNYTLIQPWLKNFKHHAFEASQAKYYRIEPGLKNVVPPSNVPKK